MEYYSVPPVPFKFFFIIPDYGIFLFAWLAAQSTAASGRQTVTAATLPSPRKHNFKLVSETFRQEEMSHNFKIQFIYIYY